MSYQVLARKWRPKTFAELAGQEHVVTALTNALARGRLHHAYLLTGTRGIGKTTIARILAKSLNCVNGVTPTPCGVCPACVEIDAGRFVDLLELDAASNTGIDNMRDILDNARYAPTVGRYKVYLIDEVHMLSKAAFNSMLKTLEEPPEHVKFVLATTDPQKIPMTVLSRCLQFNLKPLPPTVIVARLSHILDAEKIAHDEGGLALIARAAQGSVRDALSLLDQAIAFGAGEVRESVVRSMLGAVDRDHIYRIVDALVANDGAALLAESAALAARGLALGTALDELASLFHRIAVAQVVPTAAAELEDAARIEGYAARFSPESVQLAYQICVQGRADLALAPDEETGFTMALLRLLAFEPATSAFPAQAVAPSSSTPPNTGERSTKLVDANVAALRAPARAETRVSAIPPSKSDAVALPDDPARWPGFVASLKLSGMAAQIAAQTELKSLTGNALTLALPASHKHLADKAYADKLKAALEAATGRKLLLAFEVGEATDASLAARERKVRAEAQAQGEQAFRDEPFVRDLLSRFDARIKPDTIAPIQDDNATSS
jgi:DNA polymerase III subunit gamma/tau